MYHYNGNVGEVWSTDNDIIRQCTSDALVIDTEANIFLPFLFTQQAIKELENKINAKVYKIEKTKIRNTSWFTIYINFDKLTSVDIDTIKKFFNKYEPIGKVLYVISNDGKIEMTLFTKKL